MLKPCLVLIGPILFFAFKRLSELQQERNLDGMYQTHNTKCKFGSNHQKIFTSKLLTGIRPFLDLIIVLASCYQSKFKTG